MLPAVEDRGGVVDEATPVRKAHDVCGCGAFVRVVVATGAAEKPSFSATASPLWRPWAVVLVAKSAFRAVIFVDGTLFTLLLLLLLVFIELAVRFLPLAVPSRPTAVPVMGLRGCRRKGAAKGDEFSKDEQSSLSLFSEDDGIPLLQRFFEVAAAPDDETTMTLMGGLLVSPPKAVTSES